MKNLSIIALSGLAALAAAQSSTSPKTPEESCAAKCTDTLCPNLQLLGSALLCSFLLELSTITY